ncbi:MAG: hypothetical protein AAGF93_12975 [Cyanobacteria bacterium P01_H01_bin.105]
MGKDSGNKRVALIIGPEIWQSLYEVNVIVPWTLIAEVESALRQSSNED